MHPKAAPPVVLALVLITLGRTCVSQSRPFIRPAPSELHSTPTESIQEAGSDREAPDAAASSTDTLKPLPEIPTLMREVELNQRKLEALEKLYVYHSVSRQEELGSGGEVKKTTITEADHFWLNGVPVNRVVRRNGKDLTPEERAKEDERLENQARKAKERRESNEAHGKETDPQGHEEVTVSRLLALGAFSNPRRVEVEGRPTVVVDYTGDPHAKTRNRAEDAIRDLAGTAWVDENDKVLTRVDGHFANAFKIGGGLVVDVKRDTRFLFRQTRVNGEVWLPAAIEAQGAARAMLFFSFSGRVNVAYSDYRKYRVSATVLPDITPMDGSSAEPPRQPAH